MKHGLVVLLYVGAGLFGILLYVLTFLRAIGEVGSPLRIDSGLALPDVLLKNCLMVVAVVLLLLGARVLSDLADSKHITSRGIVGPNSVVAFLLLAAVVAAGSVSQAVATNTRDHATSQSTAFSGACGSPPTPFGNAAAYGGAVHPVAVVETDGAGSDKTVEAIQRGLQPADARSIQLVVCVTQRTTVTQDECAHWSSGEKVYTEETYADLKIVKAATGYLVDSKTFNTGSKCPSSNANGFGSFVSFFLGVNSVDIGDWDKTGVWDYISAFVSGAPSPSAASPTY